MSQRTDIDRLAGIMLAEFGRLHERFDRLDPRLDAIDGHLSGIGHELGDVMRRLDHLDAQIGDIRGYAKQIDALRDRLRTIEKHLGIARQIV